MAVSGFVDQNSAYAWFLAMRPKTLGAIICPVLIGSAIAFRDHKFSPGAFLFTLITCVLLQILANLINDYGDFLRGGDGKDRLGPLRAMQQGYISEKAMRLGISISTFCVLSLGMKLFFIGQWPILILGLIGLFLCASYSFGRTPLSYFGFVEPVIFLVFGPICVLGSYYINALGLSYEALAISITPGLLSAALLLTNNLRDVLEDKGNNKKTTAVRLGEKCARKLLVAMIIFSALGPILLVFFYNYEKIILCTCAALILPARHFKIILCEPISKRFNLMLASVGISLYLVGLLFFGVLCYGAS